MQLEKLNSQARNLTREQMLCVIGGLNLPSYTTTGVHNTDLGTSTGLDIDDDDRD